MLEDKVLKLLKTAGIKADKDQLEKPPQEEFGDLSFPCFNLAKIKKINPVKIASEIASKIKVPKNSAIKRVEARGPYVNFFFDYEKFSGKILKDIEKKIDIGKNKKIMVEYSQPNPVHPMHIGHARSTFLGDALANILEFVGYKVIRANYMNDIGLQVAKLVAAYSMWAKNKKPDKKPDLWLWDYYIKFHEELKTNPNLEEEARKLLRKFELEKNKLTINLWNEIVRWCVKGFEETYKKVGVDFDVYFYESDFREAGKKLIERALKEKFAFKSSEGSIVADLEKHGIPSTIILRYDGTGLYITSDLGMSVHKFTKYKLDKSVWIVSSQQNLHFQQLFKLLELLGYDWYKNCYHFSYEHVVLPEGKMSSREGRAVLLDEVIAKLISMAEEEVAKRNKETSESEKKKIAEQIGVGALKYAIIRIEPQNLITFDWKQMLSFDGNTGPYIQYAHTRCNGILKRAKKWKKVYSIAEMNEEDKTLIRVLGKYKDIVTQAVSDMKPHYICNYAYELATVFNNFYEKNPVLKAEGETRNFRLTLVSATEIYLKNLLHIIGIETPEKM